MKKRGCIALISLAVLVLIVVVIASQPSDSEPQVRTATPELAQAAPTQASPAPTKPQATETPKPRLGDVVEQYGYSLAAVAVEDPAKPGMFASVEDGEKVVAIEIIVGNISGEKIGVNPLNASLVDDEGYVYEVELGGRDGDQIDVADVNPGEKVRGWVAFVIPENATPTSIKYSVDVFSTKVLQTGVLE